MENLFLNRFKISILILLSVISITFAGELKNKTIRFIGNKRIETKVLKKLIISKKGKNFNVKDIHLDKTVIRNFYYKNGFLDIWVDFNIKKGSDGVDVLFVINEGKKYYFAGYKLTQILNRDTGLVQSQFRELKRGQPFDQALVDMAIKNLEDLYYNNGYPYVRIDVQKDFINDSSIVLNIFIKEGPKVTIKGIDIKGNREVKRSIIERELELVAGDYYSREKIIRSQKNLYSTGLFESVNLNVVSDDSDSTGAILQVNVSEKKMRYAGIRFGFSYEENATYGTSAEITGEMGHLNLFRSARSLLLTVTPSFIYDSKSKSVKNLQNHFKLNLIQPWFLFPRTVGNFDLSFYQRRPPNYFHYDVWKYALSVYRAGDIQKNKFTLSYQFITNIKNIPEDTAGSSTGEQQIFENLTAGNEKIFAISYETTKDKRNNIMVPTRGYLTMIRLSLAYSKKMDATIENPTSFLGKIEFSWNRYQPFPLYRPIILASRFRIGIIQTLGVSNFVPLSEKFRLGGASTIRGYAEGLVGPTIEQDGKIVGVGGRLSFLTNLELRYPVMKFIFLTSFLDMGNVWNETGDINPKDVRFGTGGGIALSLEFIVFRLEYGFKLFKRQNESPGILHFGIAFAF